VFPICIFCIFTTKTFTSSKCNTLFLHDTSIDTSRSTRNRALSVFDKHLPFFDQISALSKSCCHHIRALRCIRPYLDFHTAKTIATTIVHSKLDYYNCLYFRLPKYQLRRLQHIQNALARTVVQAPKFQHNNTPMLKSLHWLKFSERIEYKIISLTKILNTTQPPYLYDSVSTCIKPAHGHNTRSSPYVTDQTTVISLSHSPLLPTCFTSSLEPTFYITQNSSSELLIPLSATFI